MERFKVVLKGMFLMVGVSCLVACNSTGERVSMPGSHCSIVVPEGFVLTGDNIVKGPDSSIGFYVAGGKALSMGELMAENAAMLIEAEGDSGSAFEYEGKVFTDYRVVESELRYAVLVLQVKDFTIFINGLYPPGNEEERKAVLDAMLSVRFDGAQ